MVMNALVRLTVTAIVGTVPTLLIVAAAVVALSSGEIALP